MQIADAFHAAGVGNGQNGQPYLNDDSFGVTCSACDFVGTAATLTQRDAEHIADITDYKCPKCEQTLASVGHWGMHEQPLLWKSYRMGDYAVTFRVVTTVAGTNASMGGPADES